jgi:hypothetical protein
MNDVKRFYAKLKDAAIENPLLTVAIAAGAITATAKLIDAGTQRQNSKAWSREVDRRVLKMNAN